VDGKLLATLVSAVTLLLVVSIAVTRAFRRSNRKGRRPAAPQLKPSSVDELEPRTAGPALVSLVDEEHELADITKMADSDGAAPSNSEPVLRFEGDAQEIPAEKSGPGDLVATTAAGHTDRGTMRRRNEDTFLIDSELGLYAIADGMGGYAGGDVAARIACQQVREGIRAPGPIRASEAVPVAAQEIIAAIDRANGHIYEMAKEASEFHGMGATIVAARFSRRSNRVYIAHVGDSRCYRLRAGVFKQLTEDHTLGAAGVTGPYATHLRRAVGREPNVKVDVVVDTPVPEDVYLLCSDGLTKMVPDEEIVKLLAQRIVTAELDGDELKLAADALILAANAAGGYDNITVVLVGVMSA
jgi:PPM family protein phosphatase